MHFKKEFAIGSPPAAFALCGFTIKKGVRSLCAPKNASTKGGLISESFSLWLQSPKKEPNHHPKYPIFSWIVLKAIILHLILKIGAKVKKNSDFKPPLPCKF